MGYNTTIFILNDRLDEIKRNPEQFVRDIDLGLHRGTDYAIGQTTVMQSEHADVPRLYYTYGNSIFELSKWANRTMDNANNNEYYKDALKEAIKWAKTTLKELEKELDK